MRISDWSSDVCSSDLPNQRSLASWVDDSSVTVTLGNGKRWSPDNSDGRSNGSVRLIDALAPSYNHATVRVGMDVEIGRRREGKECGSTCRSRWSPYQ